MAVLIVNNSYSSCIRKKNIFVLAKTNGDKTVKRILHGAHLKCEIALTSLNLHSCFSLLPSQTLLPLAPSPNYYPINSTVTFDGHSVLCNPLIKCHLSDIRLKIKILIKKPFSPFSPHQDPSLPSLLIAGLWRHSGCSCSSCLRRLFCCILRVYRGLETKTSRWEDYNKHGEGYEQHVKVQGREWTCVEGLPTSVGAWNARGRSAHSQQHCNVTSQHCIKGITTDTMNIVKKYIRGNTMHLLYDAHNRNSEVSGCGKMMTGHLKTHLGSRCLHVLYVRFSKATVWSDCYLNLSDPGKMRTWMGHKIKHFIFDPGVTIES